MDLISLVEEQAIDGQRFVDRLIAEGFPVAAAAWIKEYEVGRWYLFIVSPLVDRESSWAGYGITGPILEQMPQPFHVGRFQTKLIGTEDPAGKAILEILEHTPAGQPTIYMGFPLGDMSIDEAYIYPPIATAAH
jgi:hypothetical protein